MIYLNYFDCFFIFSWYFFLDRGWIFFCIYLGVVYGVFYVNYGLYRMINREYCIKNRLMKICIVDRYWLRRNVMLL